MVNIIQTTFYCKLSENIRCTLNCITKEKGFKTHPSPASICRTGTILFGWLKIVRRIVVCLVLPFHLEIDGGDLIAQLPVKLTEMKLH